MLSLSELIQKVYQKPSNPSHKKGFSWVFQQYISAFLIFALIVSQTIQVSFFDRVEAARDDYRDIVSIVVDEDTYDTLRSEIRRYADDIQGYLRATRVTILVVPRDAPPASIAAQNEKLYYEGDGKSGISSLVGTILIGNVPIPVVEKDGVTFPSLYPYVDFEDKSFVYNQSAKRYIYQSATALSSDVEIWHGVMNPSLGGVWKGGQDIAKIRNLLDKTHAFYTKSGNFTPSTIPPRVFYYDGYNESDSVTPNDLYKYVLFTRNVENLAYKRWSKYLLSDIMTALRQFQSASDSDIQEYARTLSGMENMTIGDDLMSAETIATLPDIQTARPIGTYLKKFYEIINKKTLSDIQKFVHNAGRYNSGTLVRVDQGAIAMSMTDEVAMQTLSTANTSLEKSIDSLIEKNNYARKLVLLDTVRHVLPSTQGSSTNPGGIYKNYYFGREASTISDPLQCTIARGASGATSPFGRSIRVEANMLYDVNAIQGQLEPLTKDTEELVGIFRSSQYACFGEADGTAKLDAYYGGNSMLKLSQSPRFSDTMFDTPVETQIRGFSKDIFSLGGSRETSRLSDPSLADCMDTRYQYALEQPHTYTYTVAGILGMQTTCTGAYPDEWNRSSGLCSRSTVTNNPRFTCLTNHNIWNGSYTLPGGIAQYQNACTYGELRIDNKYYNGSTLTTNPQKLGNTCIRSIFNPGTSSNGIFGGIGGIGSSSAGYYTTIDETIYHDRSYRTIPSLMKHVSPTATELSEAEKNGVTRSLPIDIVRSVEFLTPKGNIARFTYPNFFEAPTDSRESVRRWLTSISQSEWTQILAREAATSLSTTDAQIASLIGAGSLPGSPLDWNTLISDSAIDDIIRARRWLTPDVTTKYQNIIESSLSYSQSYVSGSLDTPPMRPRSGSGYEIAYLGLAPFIPGGEEGESDDEMTDYTYRLGEIQGANIADADPGLSDPASRATAQCGAPDGVPLFQWPSAIMCWLKSIIPPRIFAGSCGGNTIGLPGNKATTRTTPPSLIQTDSAKLRTYYSGAKLVYSVPKTTLGLSDTLQIESYLDLGGERVVPSSDTVIGLEIVSIEASGAMIPASQYREYATLSSTEMPYTEMGGSFILSSQSRYATLVVRPRVSILLPDTTRMEIRGDSLTLRISDEYVDIDSKVGGKIVHAVDATTDLPVEISFTSRTQSGTILSSGGGYTLDIYDDVSSTRIASGITISGTGYILPQIYRTTLGNYRFIARDRTGRTGEATLAVRSGMVSRIEFRPVSSTVALGSTSLGVLRLLDAKNNPISPSFLTITAMIDGGYFIESDGTKTKTRKIDTIQSEIVLSYVSDTPGNMKIDFRVMDPSLALSSTLRVIEKPGIRLIRSAIPKVAGDPVDMRLEMIDTPTGKVLRGFDSIATLEIADGLGTFSRDEFEIRDGQTLPFQFIPGKKSGDHTIRITIPGITNGTDQTFTILPGVPMYIDGKITDTDIDFTLRDRYGNISPESYTGTLRKNQDTSTPITFSAGKYTLPRSTGYYRIEAPMISKNSISYADTITTQTNTGIVTNPILRQLYGISFFQLYVPDTVSKFDFASDYNARYTVLAGDSYLSEGAEILYDSTPDMSQSLAVSTLMQTPYTKDVVWSIFPDGGWTLGESMDRALDARLSAQGKIIRLDISDTTTSTPISSVGYPLDGLTMRTCDESSADKDTCVIPDDLAKSLTFVRFTDQPSYRIQSDTSSIHLTRESIALMSYTKNAGLLLAPGISLRARSDISHGRMVADVIETNRVIGRIILAYNTPQGIEIAPLNTAIQSITLDPSHAYSRTQIYGGVFRSDRYGYSIYRPTDSLVLDERIIGPNHIDSIGALREVPGVGWHGKNRMLLSFAAGDTVGESTRWFHDYTFVNLGDPVAHVDPRAPGTETDGIDRSIGTQIAASNERTIRTYKHRDMNADGLEDIIVIYDDGFMELYLNMGGVFRKKQKIAYLPEIGSRGIDFGDFMGDGYADILSRDTSGSFLLVDNTNRRLTEKAITLAGGGSMPSGISQYRIYDMDADKKDDIVYLTEGGTLGILYGTSTAGVFTEKILENTLGIRLSDTPQKTDGALRASSTPRALLTSSSTGVDMSVINGEVFYEKLPLSTSASTSSSTNDTIISITESTDTDALLSQYFSDPNLTPVTAKTANTSLGSTPIGVGMMGTTLSSSLYVRSEYASVYGLDIQKRYRNISSDILHAGDRIQVEITLKNTSSGTIRDITYLDTVPKIFSLSETTRYRSILDGQSREDDIVRLTADDYDIEMRGGDIPAGQTMILTYELEALSAEYGDMIVDRLEGGTVGDDIYGDIGFETSNSCGAEMMLWSSTDARAYDRGSRSFDTTAQLPPALASKLADSDKNGVPDSVENASPVELKKQYDTMGSQSSLSSRSLIQSNLNVDSGVFSLGFDPSAAAEIETIAQNLSDGLSCGFGGGSCLSFPINWAPLAPGNDPTVLGQLISDFNPTDITSGIGASSATTITNTFNTLKSSGLLGDGLKIDEGVPLFSALTCMPVPIPCGKKICTLGIPAAYPASPIGANTFTKANGYPNGAACGNSSFAPGAGGILGINFSKNVVRVFVTPTLTLGMGAAVCLGPPKIAGRGPLFPLIPYGNCIVMTKAMPVCKGDGSSADGDVRAISGLGTTTNAWNGQSCSMQARTTTDVEDESLIDDVVSYLRSPETTRLNNLYKAISKRGARTSNWGGPLVRIGDGRTSGTQVDISLDSIKSFDPNEIIKVKNRRITGFPEFIMDWVARQTDEISNKLLSLPNLVIIPPRNFGQNAALDGSFSDFLDRFSESSLSQGWEDFQQKVGDAANVDAASQFTNRTRSNNEVGKAYEDWLDTQVSKNADTINTVAGGANQIKAAYQFISQLPFIRIEKATVPINIPWLLPQELDRYTRTLEQYQSEISRAESSWCLNKTPAECADIKTRVGLGGLSSAIEQNLRRVNEWSEFPNKIQNYLTWKQRYITQILCNVDAVEQILGGWYRDNGVRFKRWAEFYVLMKTIASSWQPFLDIFRDKDRACAVCQNQRWSHKFSKFKILSAVIPQIPILQFPRWPDFVLNLSDIRLGVLIRVPDFRFNINPIRLPALPGLVLPGLPGVGLNLPSLPVLPPIPQLPNLPDLPSLPRIALPNLPPPPRLPKLFGAVAASLRIFGLLVKIQCFMEKTPLVPEDYVGMIIAQRTDRQGTLPFDFLSLQFPQIAIPSVREIGASTHVNFEVKSDFITEYARASVAPINELNADFANLPTKIGPDVNFSTPSNVELTPLSGQSYPGSSHGTLSLLISALSDEIRTLESTQTELLDVEDFIPFLRKELLQAGLDVDGFDRRLELARKDADTTIEKTLEEHARGYRYLREYLEAEQAETKRMEKVLDRMYRESDLLTESDIPLARLIASESDMTTPALEKYTNWQKDRLAGGITLEKDRAFERQMTSLARQTDRLLAATTASTTDSVSSSQSMAEGYSMNYEGIYIITPVSGVQTRLFDYLDDLTGEDTADVVDIDKDGDDDYIYMMGGALYIKYATRTTPERPRETDITTVSLDVGLTPVAPDFFSEVVASPGQIQVSFRPTDTTQRAFRLEFFDRYLEWDSVALGGRDTPEAPRTIIDMTVTDPILSATGISTSPVLRSLQSVSSASGFILEGQKVSVLSTGQDFSLSTGRALYTGNQSTRLIYTTLASPTPVEQVLEPFTRYIFPSSLSGSISRGKAYVLTPSGSEKLSYTDDMRGMPLLPGTRIFSPTGDVVIYDATKKASTPITPGTEYRHISLGKQSDAYMVYFPYQNGFYSAKLHALSDEKPTHAGVTLFVPMASLDRSPPVLNLSDRIRIPVYQTMSLRFADIITDMSSYTVKADEDTTVDADKNSIFDDDYVSSGTHLSITKDILTIGGYDSIGTHMLKLQITDAYGNTTESPLTLEVYAPMPSISSVSSDGVLSGSIDTILAGEPIDIFRVRPGDTLRRLPLGPIMTQVDGTYATGGLYAQSGVVFVSSGVRIPLRAQSYIPATADMVVDFLPATSTTPMQMRVSRTDKTRLYTLDIIPPKALDIYSLASYSGARDDVILTTIGTGYRLTPASARDPSIPGGSYIMSLDGVGLLALDTYGQLYALESELTFIPETTPDGYLSLRIRKKGTPIATLTYYVDFFPTAR